MEELLRRVRAGDVIVVDARPATEYAAGHIPGALSIPVDDLTQRLHKLPKSKPYVAYCRGPYCVYADQAVEQLRAAGRRARRLAVGLPEWKSAGLPVEVGAEPGGRSAAS
jgi:rhodanese-related sulfurtransferase